MLCAVVALIALLAYGLVQNEPDRGRGGARQRRVRAGTRLELPELDGDGRGSLADYRGKVVVLNFWASWSPAVPEESPLLERWHRRMVSGTAPCSVWTCSM